MDNDAFRALVAERARAKTTKEIAREAVEEEFRRKKGMRRGGGKKRGRGGGVGGGGASSSDSEGVAGGGSDDDDDDGDDDDDDDKNDGKRYDGEEEAIDDDGNADHKPLRKKSRRRTPDGQVDDGGRTKYRDRARERREGKNVDYADASALLEKARGVAAARAGVAGTAAGGGRRGVGGGGYRNDDENDDDDDVAAEMSKFLGGDEAHTHLVRGLDWALAQKVRREEMGFKEGDVGKDDGHDDEKDAVADLDDVVEEAAVQARRRMLLLEEIKSDPEGALVRLVRTTRSVPGRAMIAYLRFRWGKRLGTHRRSGAQPAAGVVIGGSIGGTDGIGPSDAGLSVQRSTLSFTVLPAHPGNVRRCWEVPVETTLSKKDHDRLRGEEGPFRGRRELTPLDGVWIERIRDALKESNRGRGGLRGEANKGVGVAKEERAGVTTKEKHRKKKENKRKRSRKETKKARKRENSEELGTDQEVDDNDDSSSGDGDGDGNGNGNGNGMDADEEAERDGVENGTTRKTAATFSSADAGDGNVSSDEDIFADAGEYVPPAVKARAEEEKGLEAAAAGTTMTTTTVRNDDPSREAGENDKKTTTTTAINTKCDDRKKSSVFSGLVLHEKKEQEEQCRRTERLPADRTPTSAARGIKRDGARAATGNVGKRSVVDRDVFGGGNNGGGKGRGRNVSAYEARAAGGVGAAGGVSLSSYGGGYGEEMDADFGGYDDDDDGENGGGMGKGKKGLEESTTAVKEYGSRGGQGKRGGSEKDDDGGRF